MAKAFSEQEREKIIEKAVSHILKTGDSYRETALYLSNEGYKVSHVTIKDYCDRYITSMKEDFESLQEIIDNNTAKGIKDNEVKKRILRHAKEYALSELEIDDIAKKNNISFQTVYNDLTKRLPEYIDTIDNEDDKKIYALLNEQVKIKAKTNKIDNLRNKNGR